MVDFADPSNFDEIFRNMEKFKKWLQDAGYDLEEVSKQLKIYHDTEAKRIYQMRDAIIKWEQVNHYMDESLKRNKADKAFRTQQNIMENTEYFRQIRRNMEIRRSHADFGEQMALTTKALFGGGIGLGAVFGMLMKSGRAVAYSQEEEADLRKDILGGEKLAKEGESQSDRDRGAESAANATEELKRYLESPASKFGKLQIHGLSISKALQHAGKFFNKHKVGIAIGIGSIGLLITAMKLIYNTSPMMQASVKLLGLMWNLGLRPIGDFFGFIMRPIFVMLLRSFILPWYKVAYPFYQKWGNKIGELMSNFTLQGFADLTWEWFNEADSEMKDLSIAIGLLAGATGLGLLIATIKGIKALWDKLFPKPSTPTSMGTNVKTSPALPPPRAGTNISTFPEHLKPFSKLYNKQLPYKGALPATGRGGISGTSNIGFSKNITTWINKQWGHIRSAGDRLGKSFQQMADQFWKSMSKNPVLSRFFTPDKLKGVVKGGTKGVVGFIPPIIGNIMEAINPDQWAKDVKKLYELFPFFDPSYGTDVEMAHGGVIREPVFGVGKSGKTYSFGERGAETVSPIGAGGGVGITINIENMSGSQQDLNNLRQTILAVMQESNTRSGRI